VGEDRELSREAPVLYQTLRAGGPVYHALSLVVEHVERPREAVQAQTIESEGIEESETLTCQGGNCRQPADFVLTKEIADRHSTVRQVDVPYCLWHAHETRTVSGYSGGSFRILGERQLAAALGDRDRSGLERKSTSPEPASAERRSAAEQPSGERGGLDLER
jgi:hypothetical protein